MSGKMQTTYSENLHGKKVTLKLYSAMRGSTGCGLCSGPSSQSTSVFNSKGEICMSNNTVLPVRVQGHNKQMRNTATCRIGPTGAALFFFLMECVFPRGSNWPGYRHAEFHYDCSAAIQEIMCQSIHLHTYIYHFWILYKKSIFLYHTLALQIIRAFRQPCIIYSRKL